MKAKLESIKNHAEFNPHIVSVSIVLFGTIFLFWLARL